MLKLYIMSELKDQLSLLGRKTEYKQDYAPEVFEPIPNISMYNQIINTSLSEV